MELNFIEKSDIDVLMGNLNNHNILLSIVIPTYNRPDFLMDAIDSIIDEVQTYDNVELIVLSNKSDDDMQYLKKYENTKLIVLRNRINLGMAGNITKCCLVANGRYISYLHDDDLLCKGYCEEMLNLITNGNYSAIVPARKVLYSDESWGKSQRKKMKLKMIANRFLCKEKRDIIHVSLDDILKSGRNCLVSPTCGTCFKKEDLIQVDCFQNGWIYSFDLITYNNLLKMNKDIVLYKKNLGYYRMTVSASNEAETQLEFFKALRFVLMESSCHKDYKEYLNLFKNGLSKKSIELINHQFHDELKGYSKIRYFLLKIKTNLYFYKKGLFIEKI